MGVLVNTHNISFVYKGLEGKPKPSVSCTCKEPILGDFHGHGIYV